MKRRIIIEYDDSRITDLSAVEWVVEVMKGGRVSVARGIKHYCWYTTFWGGLGVWTRKKRSEGAADSFVVEKEKTHDLCETRSRR